LLSLFSAAGAAARAQLFLYYSSGANFAQVLFRKLPGRFFVQIRLPPQLRARRLPRKSRCGCFCQNAPALFPLARVQKAPAAKIAVGAFLVFMRSEAAV